MLAVVLAGGYGACETGILRAMSGVRRAMALDLAERCQAATGVRTVFVSDEEDLLRQAAEIGCATRRTGEPFVWLSEVQAAIRTHMAHPEESVLVLGGSAAPFLTAEGIEQLAEREEPGCAWLNNRLSPDLIFFAPARSVFEVKECRTDNDFGYALEKQAGLTARYLPSELMFAYDVDTPLDALLAAKSPRSGHRLREAVLAFNHRVRLEEAFDLLRRGEYRDVAVIGRAHPVEAERFAQACQLRLRLYSEERGMKALGRIERGEVRSLVGELVRALGWQGFFSHAAQSCALVLFDTRVVLAEQRREISDGDRFASDLLMDDDVHDLDLREMARAAAAAPIPILLGGQTLVSGGLRLLREELGPGETKKPQRERGTCPSTSA